MIENGPRQAFIKPFPMDEWRTDYYDESERLRLYEKAGNAGISPNLLAVALSNDPKGRGAYILEHVNGFTLRDFPEERDDLKFSVGFAQNLGYLFRAAYSQRLLHTDAHNQNIMYDTDMEKCVFVDITSFIEVDREFEMKKVVNDFGELLLSTYLGDNPFEHMEEFYRLEEDDTHYTFSTSEFIPGMQKIQQQMKKEESGIRQPFWENSRAPILFLLHRKGVLNKIDPVIREFMLRAINPKTCPENFDELFSAQPAI